MTPAEMITELEDFGFADHASGRKYALLNQVLQEITLSRPWPWREAVVTLTFAGSSATPSNSNLYMSSVRRITNPSTGNRIRPVRSEVYQERAATELSEAGDPIMYYFDGTALKFWRVPAATVTLTCRYLKYQPDVTSGSAATDVLLPERYHWLPIYRLAARSYAKDEDLEMADYYQGLSASLEEQMVQDMFTLWQYDEADSVQIVDDDDYFEGDY